MARKRQMNTIRTDYLEQMIALYEALGRDDKAQVLRTVARDVFAPISEEAIDDYKEKVMAAMFARELVKARQEGGAQ